MARLTRVFSSEAFIRDPIGHYSVGDGFLVWCVDPTLSGVTLWGQTSEDGLRGLIRLFDRGEADGGAMGCFLVDARLLDTIDGTTFREFLHHAMGRLEWVRRRATRHALVRGPGLAGALLTGFYAVFGTELEWRGFSEVEPALEWLDGDRPLVAELARASAEASSGSSLLEPLRTWLREGVGQPVSVDAAARELGLSLRTLQRRLLEAGTSFRAEVDRTRVAAAQKLLIETDHKIATLSHRLGCSSEANFVSYFRRRVGLPPGEWRRRQRAALASGVSGA